ncbi:MAG: hypothetical protein AAB544_01155 [Patescibacteria group bacterium]
MDVDALYPAEAREEHYMLGTNSEWDYDEALFALGAVAQKMVRTESDALQQEFRIARAAATRLLRLLEIQNNLGPDNPYRQNFRNVMKEKRELPKTPVELDFTQVRKK